jgi:hypothetical protein
MTQFLSKPFFPPVIDATTLASFRSCPQKAFRSYVQHWKPQAESVHLVAGGAFAKGIEVARRAFFEGVHETPIINYNAGVRTVAWVEEAGNPVGDKATAEALGLQALIAKYGDFECPPDSGKSLTRTAGALEFYYEQYPFGEDGMEPITLASGRRGIEFSFATPIGIDHPQTGDPILYAGRADLIANFSNGIYIVDEKTTSSLGQSWSRQWEMRGQFTGYMWAAAEQGVQTTGCIVRGVSILKTKYDTMQVLTYRTPHEIDLWHKQTLRDIHRMIACWREGYWDYALDGACTEYGGCSMVRVCKSPSPEEWLPMYFEKRVWDPLGRVEKTQEAWEAEWGYEAVPARMTQEQRNDERREELAAGFDSASDSVEE